MELSRRDDIIYDDQGVPVDPLHRTEFSFFGNGEFKPPPGRVVGVYYDKQRRIWRANWREGDVGKRKTKNFSVDDYGFEEARRLAIEYRLMKITEIAQMELNCPEIDRIRLSTCRAPAQPSAGDRRKRMTCGGVDTPRKRQRSKSALPDADPYLYNGNVPPPGDFYDPNGDQYGMYWTMPYYYNNPQPTDNNYMWYYSPDVLYNLYNQAVTPGQGGPVNPNVEQLYAPLMTSDGSLPNNPAMNVPKIEDTNQETPLRLEMSTQQSSVFDMNPTNIPPPPELNLHMPAEVEQQLPCLETNATHSA